MGVGKATPQVYSLFALSTDPAILPQDAKSVISISAAQNGLLVYVLLWIMVLFVAFGIPLVLVRIFKKELGIATRINFAKAYILSFYVWVFVLVLVKVYFYWATDLKYFLVTDWVNV